MSGVDDAWAGDRVARWLRQADGLERQLDGVSRLLLAAAAVRPGEAVLDVGCGVGPTTRDAALAAGPDGRVTGLDVSAEMLAAAAARPVPPGAAPLDWLEADVVAWAPGTPAYDVVISRFGVMFFSDPATAFAHLADATGADGRLALAVWGRRDESELFEVPYAVARAVREERGDPFDPLPVDGGPFSLHDEGTVLALLERAGWRDVRMAAHVVPLPFAGGTDAAGAARAALDFGPTRLVLLDSDEATRTAAREALEAAFAGHLDTDGHVVLDAAVRIVTARR